MKLVRSALVAGLVLVPAISMALPTFVKTFTDTYKTKIPAGSALSKAGCTTCHSAGTKLNPFGESIKAQLTAMKTKTITPAILAKVESMDSDKDGVKNIDEIKKGTLPGDAKSK